MSATTLGPVPRLPVAAVLDSNVVLDLWVFRDPRVQGLGQALHRGELQALGCPALRDELAHVLDRGLAAAWGADREQVLAAWDRTMAQPLKPDPLPLSRLPCSDPDDQKFLELALTHRAKWLFTSDRALLKLAKRAALRGLVICSAHGWGWPQTA